MRNSWLRSPAAVIADAAASTAGGVATIVLALCAGTQLGAWIVAREWLDVATVAVATLGVTAAAFGGWWGLVYLPALIYTFYATIFDEASRLRVAFWVTLLQLVALVSLPPLLFGQSPYMEPGGWLRLTIVAAAFALAATGWRVARRRALRRIDAAIPARLRADPDRPHRVPPRA